METFSSVSASSFSESASVAESKSSAASAAASHGSNRTVIGGPAGQTHTARDFIFLDEGVEYPHQGMERGEDRNGIAQEVRLELDEKTLAAVRGT